LQKLTGKEGPMTEEKESGKPRLRVKAPKPKSSHDLANDNIWRQMTANSWTMTIFAILSALVIGAVLICATDSEVQRTAGYLFAQPSDFFSAIGGALSTAFGNLFKGAIFDVNATGFANQIQPLTETLTLATPLILAGLGLAVGFEAGLFNIGGQGQVIIGATMAGFIGFKFDLPIGVHLLLALIGGVLAGGVWAGIAGVLKAKTGANEVVVTIMLNYIATYLLAFLLTLDAFHRPGLNQPKTPPIQDDARLGVIWGAEYGWRLNWGFIIAIAAAVGVWFLMSKSTLGFRFRAVGANEKAAKTAGISVPLAFIAVMAVAGALCGLAGATQILGTQASEGLSGSIGGSLGFDAITVALLGRNKPVGVVWAGILFGALSAGGRAMAAGGQPIEIVMILQSVIVLFIAAPPLVRMLFRLGKPGLPKHVDAPSNKGQEVLA
jgi:simple sugar transport system permease protein